MLDTNSVLDYLNERDPFYASSRLLMIGGRAGEFDLWITSSQITDLIYILSDGGKTAGIPPVLERLRGLRTFVSVCAIGSNEIDRMLATSWKDPEGALLFEAALEIRADFLISRNQKDFESSMLPVLDCEGFFEWMRKERKTDYGEIELVR